MAVWNAINPVSVGDTAKKNQYDRAFDNALALQEASQGLAYLRMIEQGAPTAASGEGTVYADSATRRIMGSRNAGAFRSLQGFELIHVNAVQNAVSGASREQLALWNMPADTLDVVDSMVVVQVSGTTAANANNKRMEIEFAGTVVAGAAQPYNNQRFWLRLEILMTAVGQQQCTGFILGSDNDQVAFTQKTEDETAAIAVTFDGDGGAASDIVFEQMWAWYIPAPF